jgi:hypothetical protein
MRAVRLQNALERLTAAIRDVELELAAMAKLLESGIGSQRVPDLTRLLLVRLDLLRA